MPSYPQGDLETPFLKEELFVGESEAGWEARVAALEAESPFQSALEQDQTTLIESKEMEGGMLAEEIVEDGKRAVSAHVPVEQADSYSEEAEQSADLVDGVNAELFSEEEDELEEVLTDEEEEESRAVDEILSGLDRAVSLNRRYGEELGWRVQYDTMARFLGFIDYSPDEKTFAEAIARWQRSQSLKGDGILGPETWARLRAALPADNREPFPARSQPTSFNPTPVEAPGGGRIKELTEPRQAELTTVEGFGGKPVELHRLAAEAWMALVQAARSDGFGAPLLLPISGYRGIKRQEVLWQEALKKYGSREEARKWVAPPGGSAHQTGRTIDFYLGGKNSSGNVANLRKHPIYRWLVVNAARFGFYPYEREPWHWEYNPPAQRHEQEQEESILLKESDEFLDRSDKEDVPYEPEEQGGQAFDEVPKGLEVRFDEASQEEGLTEFFAFEEEELQVEELLAPWNEAELLREAEETSAADSLPITNPSKEPLEVPPNNPVPFADPPAMGSYWPLRTSIKEGREVNFQATDRSHVGSRPARRFHADRPGGRYHNGVDLFGNLGDPVIACEGGKVINFYGFCCRPKYTTWAILVEHPSVVINYGEVTPDSLMKVGLTIGKEFEAGRIIGFLGRNPGGSSMLHFETYVKGTIQNAKWIKGKDRPPELRNPTKYLLFLQENGLVKAATGTTTADSAQLVLGSLTKRIQDALRIGQWSLALGLAILRGQRDENELTNLIFYSRHPELDGRRIKRDEKELAQEWLSIRDRLVRPALTLAPSKERISSGSDS